MIMEGRVLVLTSRSRRLFVGWLGSTPPLAVLGGGVIYNIMAADIYEAKLPYAAVR